MFVRVEVAVRPEFVDPGIKSFLRRVQLVHPEIYRKIRWGRHIDVYWVDIESTRERMISAISEVFQDKVLNWLFTGNLIPAAAGSHGNIEDLMEHAPERPGVFWALEKRYRSGVTDNVGRTIVEAFEIVLGEKSKNAHASSGSMILIEGPKLTEDDLSLLARDLFCNELIESWTLLSEEELRKSGRFHPDQVKRQISRPENKARSQIEIFNLERMSEKQLEQLSYDRLLALNNKEMKAIQNYFANPETQASRKELGLNFATDVELEILGQTWSEHCKHKIFAAKIEYKDSSKAKSENIPTVIDGLFKSAIVAATEKTRRPWLISVFDDNAGIIGFDEEDAVCIKVETHNSPSALDPYGGALTGIVGVNRDILGVGRGAKPIFNTDVFCVAPLDYSKVLPDRILHPRRILEGLRRGVEHGGNKSGIPTINGAVLFDNSYLGKPLVYCGTGGIIPRVTAGQESHKKEIVPGDAIVMIGGRIGKDGIHGATFSSLALDEASPQSAVQLGDPITQKRMMDFLLEARELGLYRTLTDNGAGGLSSSVGELANLSGGARLDVTTAKTKYNGLKPYELVVSESQERMTLAVSQERLDYFMAFAERRGVEVSVLGEFNNSGRFDVVYENKYVASLNLEFLHKGCPKLELKGEWTGIKWNPGFVEISYDIEARKRILEILGRPNIASKEWLIRQYDHEVQGMSVVKPLQTPSPGMTTPNDAGVIKPKSSSWLGLAVGCGINPKLSEFDTYLMAQSAVDEAIRNVLCVGAEYGTEDSIVSLVDNFCWPDPIGDSYKTAQLVRAGFGVHDSCVALGIPLISGKDSMKNDYRGRVAGQEVKISVAPTLLMTAMARVSDIRNARTADFKVPGDRIYLLGPSQMSLMGSEYQIMQMDRLKERGGDVVQVALPSSVITSQNSTGVLGTPTWPKPDWDLAKRLYAWIGGAMGKKQTLLRSMHDVSEGGSIITIIESMLARKLGAQVLVPEGADIWSFTLGEGFHTFVVSAGDSESQILEAEWKEYQIPFARIGVVTGSGELDIRWYTGDGEKKIVIPHNELVSAWRKEGYWE